MNYTRAGRWYVIVLRLTVLLNDGWTIDKIDLIVGHDVVDIVCIGLKCKSGCDKSGKKYMDFHSVPFKDDGSVEDLWLPGMKHPRSIRDW